MSARQLAYRSFSETATFKEIWRGSIPLKLCHSNKALAFRSPFATDYQQWLQSHAPLAARALAVEHLLHDALHVVKLAGQVCQARGGVVYL